MVGSRVYVGGLPYGVRERDLERFFKGYGRTRDILLKNGYGFVVSTNLNISIILFLEISNVKWPLRFITLNNYRSLFNITELHWFRLKISNLFNFKRIISICTRSLPIKGRLGVQVSTSHFI